MKKQLLEDMNKESSVAPVIEVCYEEDGLYRWADVIEGQGVNTDKGVIDLADLIIYNVRIKK